MQRLVPVVMLAMATKANAEVMDKELSIPVIWGSTALVVLLAVGGSLLARWLLLITFFLAVPLGPTFAWTEWHNAMAGPAIAREAGATYGLHANSAMCALILAHLVLWVFASRRHRLRLERSGRCTQALPTRSTLQTTIFTCLIALLTMFAATSGFGAGPAIWVSPPLLLSVTAVIISGVSWLHARSTSRPTTAST